MKYLSNQSITLKAYETRPLNMSGSVISVSYASGPFMLSIDGGEEFQINQGWTINQSPESFRFLTVRNPLAVAVTINIYIGSRFMSYSPPQTLAVISNAATYSKGWDNQVLGAGATVIFNGTDAVTGKKRKQFIVRNLDAANIFYIQDAAGKNLYPVLATESFTAESDASFTLYNPNGGGIGFLVGEIFYA